MKYPLFPILLLLSTVFPYSATALQKGVALGLYSKDPQYTYQSELGEIKETGADHISLVISWYQKNIRSNTLAPHFLTKETPKGDDLVTTPDRQLIDVIERAHHLGLKVFLFPIIRLEERKAKEWRGQINPTEPATWWESYRQFVLSYARLAARHHVEIYSVGSELCSMEEKTNTWRHLIKEVRDVYPGRLLYSANWDHYRKITFWRDLDFLGINGYYKLASRANPALNELVQQWHRIRDRLYAWQDLYNRPIILTELGYLSMDGTSQAPWDYSKQGPINLEEQSLCYEAFFRTWGREARLGGVYFWNWFGEGGPADTSYTPRHKPAEQVLTRWFQKLPPSSSSASTSPPAVPQSRSTMTSPRADPNRS